MKQIYAYQCDSCKSIFSNEEKAKDCEDKHGSDVKIKDLIYIAGGRFPSELSIEVTLNDGGIHLLNYCR